MSFYAWKNRRGCCFIIEVHEAEFRIRSPRAPKDGLHCTGITLLTSI